MNLLLFQVYGFTIFCSSNYPNDDVNQPRTTSPSDLDRGQSPTSTNNLSKTFQHSLRIRSQNQAAVFYPVEDFYSYVYTLRNFEIIKLFDWEPNVPNLLPIVDLSAYLSPFLRCLHACKSFRDSLPRQKEETTPLLSAISNICYHLHPDDESKDQKDYREPVQLSLHTLLSECSIRTESVNYMSMPQIQEFFFSKINCEFTYIEDEKYGNRIQIYGRTERCQNCLAFKMLRKRYMETTTDIIVDEKTPIEQTLNEHFNGKLPQYLSKISECTCEGSDKWVIREYETDTDLRIINFENPCGYRHPTPDNITVSDVKYELQAFIVKNDVGFAYSCIKYTNKWYLIRDQDAYEICKINYFLERGDQNQICYYQRA